MHRFQHRKVIHNGPAQHLGGFFRLPDALLRNGHVQFRQTNRARVRILQPVQQLTQDHERIGHDAAGQAGVHPFPQHLDLQVEVHLPP